MNFIAAFARLLQIRAGEGRTVALLWLHSFCLGVALIFAVTAGNALFVSRLGSKSLPFVYLAASLIVPVTGFIYLAIQKRFSFRAVLVINISVCLTAFLLLRVAFIFGDARVMSAALLIWYDVLFSLANLSFWPLAGRLFDIRQAKRLYGLVGSGELLAGILGGFSVPLILKWVSTEDLLTISALAMSGSLLVITVTLRSDIPGTTSKEWATDSSSPKTTSRGYVRLICLISAVMFFSYFIVDKAFYDQAQKRFADPEKLAAFLGVFFGIVEFCKYLGRMFVTGRFLNSFGARGGLIAMPVVLTIAAMIAVILLFVPTLAFLLFWVACGTKLMDRVVRFAIDRPAVLVLYQPLPADERESVQATAEGILGPIAGGLAALTLLLLNFLWPDSQVLLVVLIPLCAYWIWIGWRLGKRYVDMLGCVLAMKRSKNQRNMTLDSSGRGSLTKYLRSQKPAVVLSAIELLEDWDRHTVLEVLAKRREMLDGRLQSQARKLLGQEIKRAAWVVKKRLAVADRDERSLLTQALEAEFVRIRQRLVWLLTLAHSTIEMSIARSRFLGGTKSEQAMALELIENQLPSHLKEAFQMLAEGNLDQTAERLPRQNLNTQIARQQHLKQLIERESSDSAARWTRICAMFSIVGMPSSELIQSATKCLDSVDPLLRETTVSMLNLIAPDMLKDFCSKTNSKPGEREYMGVALQATDGIQTNRNQETEATMLTLDKVLLLKSVSIFENVPHGTLANFAKAVDEIILETGDSLYSKGENEHSLYVVVSGQIRLYVDDSTIGIRNENELVGEVAAFDAGPRESSAVAVEKTRLMRIEATALRNLLNRHSDITQAALREMCMQLRQTNQPHKTD